MPLSLCTLLSIYSCDTGKNCVFSQFTATPDSPTSLKGAFKALNAMRVYSHSYWLVTFVYNQ